MSLHATTARKQSARHIVLTGDVQGYGIRPEIARLAKSLSLAGTVRNSNLGVEIEIQGTDANVQRFCSSLAAIVPEAILATETVATKTQPGFQITPSNTDSIPSLELPLDRVVCGDCLTEVFTPGNRRFGYALNSCAKCGPRFSIMRGTPYDRERTSMADFPMCEICASEFLDPSCRRFHAQTNCCPKCGPQVWFADDRTRIEHRKPIELAAAALRDGNILAIKGIGGYQLVCDATNEHTVRRLRNCKGREAKPLAVMVDSLREAQRLADIDALEENALKSPGGPIVILKARIKNTLADNIQHGLGSLGIMLPTTAMHAMLARTVGRPLVVTSGNREGEPMQFDEKLAETALASIADCFLHHDRPIATELDDSVVRCMGGQIATVRAGRGKAPMHLSIPGPPGLATGGQQKVAIAISNGQRSFLGSHIGDMNSLANRNRFEQQVKHAENMLSARPAILACDEHPDYFTSEWSSRFDHVQPEPVQHHHAHIAASMVAQGWLEREVLGFAFDGTGFGSDASIWGGEVLLASLDSFRRVAHLRRFKLPSGEQAIREPWRIAVSLICEAYEEGGREVSSLLNLAEPRLSQVASLLETDLAPSTSSMGRLFDGVAAIALGTHVVNFEGEAAMRLEAACEEAAIPGSYPFVLSTNGSWPIEIDWRSAIRSLVADLVAGETAETIATRFHRGIADCVADLADRFSEHPVVLSGGVFQNRVLVELVSERTLHRKSPVALPGRIPVNDGGLAAGQLAIATRRFQENKSCV